MFLTAKSQEKGWLQFSMSQLYKNGTWCTWYKNLLYICNIEVTKCCEVPIHKYTNR